MDRYKYNKALAPILLAGLSVLGGCEEKKNTLFTLQDPGNTNIAFTNTIEEDWKLNILKYEYMYNGGGVAAGDFNNDGLQDLYFTGNQVDNALYLNKGNWLFENIAGQAGVKGKKGWKTGVTTVDINNDGFLDLYVCYSGPGSDEDRANELFINNGKSTPSFTEQAKAFGIDASGTYSTQASFFDFDGDGDLDMFLLNHAKITYSPFYNTKKLRSLRHPRYGNRLYRNDNGKFTDVSTEAGIHGSGINFGLGVSISDLNEDGWPDIYVTNDYEEQDYFYLNEHNGTFRECLKESFRHIARFGMGSDIADFNNDGHTDVFVTDMLPEDNYRQKLLKGPDEFDKYNLLRDSGYHHQNMRNMLQLNLGCKPGSPPIFSEIGQLAGVSNTDWSWCPLFVDLDNDGWKDLFVTNGYLRDYTNMDFLKYAFEDKKQQDRKDQKPFDTLLMIKSIPSTKISNYCFQNNTNLTFTDVSTSWGLAQNDISNGAVFVDLDNDGDSDIVTNRINEPAGIYRNNSSNHYIKLRLQGSPQNISGIGGKIKIKTKDTQQLQEHFPTRGFQSSVPHELIFGTGTNSTIEEITVVWPDQKQSILKNIPADTIIEIRYRPDLPLPTGSQVKPAALFADAVSESPFKYKHHDNNFIDYKNQFLVPYQLSSTGPCLARGDVNGDGYDDVYIGASLGSAGVLYKSNATGSKKYTQWTNESGYEDTGALFFDADNDKDLDLYVVSGGTEFNPENNVWLQDRLYLNDGSGNFTKTAGLPTEKSNGSLVIAADYDQDGDEDLFVGGKTLPGYFPLPAYSYLLRNDSQPGNIKFTDVTPDFLSRDIIITAGAWSDYNGDGWKDLIVTGEFAPIMLVENKKGKLIYDTTRNLPNSHGLWSTMMVTDVDGDGDEDIIAGNAGLNTQFKATPNQPLTIHYQDFNEDGQLDPLISYFIQNKSHIYPSRDELLEQMPHLKRKFVTYADYANAELGHILTADQLKKARILKAETLSTTLYLNQGNGKFETHQLPIEAQFSKVNGIIVKDYNKDGKSDILLSGNFFPYRVQMGRNDASTGLLLVQKSPGLYVPMSCDQSGFYADGDVRSMISIHAPSGEYILCGVNNDFLKIFKVISK
jgi:hypothetical protein